MSDRPMADHLVDQHCSEEEFIEWVDEVADNRDLNDCHDYMHESGQADHEHAEVSQ